MRLEKIRNRYNDIVRYQVDGIPRKRHDISELSEVSCLNCGTRYQGNFCPCCGQTAKTTRFNTRQTLKHLLFIFTKFDDTFWHTTRDLLTRPGHMIRDYLKGKRADHLRPMQMLICLITAYLIILHILPDSIATEAHISFIDDNNALREKLSSDFLQGIYDYIDAMLNNMIVTTLLNVSLMSLSCWLVMGRTKEGREYNYAEHFYTFVYFNCLVMLVRFVYLPVAIIIGTDGTLGDIVEIALGTWIYAQMLRITWRKGVFLYMSSFVVFCVLLFSILCIIIGGYTLILK